MLDSVARLLKRGGLGAVTTNRIAETAGVSIGSVYQYFPNKQAIFVALHDRHAEQMAGLVEARLREHAASPVDALVRALVEAMVAAHALDPALHQMLFSQIPPEAAGEAGRTHEFCKGAFRLAIESKASERLPPRDRERVLFVLTTMVEELTHAAVLKRPARVSLASATDEVVRAVLGYLRVARI